MHLLFLFKVLAIWYAFYTYGTAQFILAMFLVAMVLGRAALNKVHLNFLSQTYIGNDRILTLSWG